MYLEILSVKWYSWNSSPGHFSNFSKCCLVDAVKPQGIPAVCRGGCWQQGEWLTSVESLLYARLSNTVFWKALLVPPLQAGRFTKPYVTSQSRAYGLSTVLLPTHGNSDPFYMGCGGASQGSCVEGRGQLWESLLSFHHVGSSPSIQVTRLPFIWSWWRNPDLSPTNLQAGSIIMNKYTRILLALAPTYADPSTIWSGIWGP